MPPPTPPALSDTESLRTAITLFHTDARGLHLRSAFLDLGAHLAAYRREEARFVGHVKQDLWNVSTLLLRLEWMRELAGDGTLPPDAWRNFAAVDIESVFVQIRSAMDHVAEGIDCLHPKRGQLPDSFRRLRESLAKYRGRLPAELALLIEQATWFDQMRHVRDAFVHQGGMPLVFGEPEEGLLFQIYGGQRDAHVSLPSVMFNENVAYFDRYVAILCAHFLTFLDKLGSVLFDHVERSESIGPSRAYSSGFALLKTWMENVLSLPPPKVATPPRSDSSEDTICDPRR